MALQKTGAFWEECLLIAIIIVSLFSEETCLLSIRDYIILLNQNFLDTVLDFRSIGKRIPTKLFEREKYTNLANTVSLARARTPET